MFPRSNRKENKLVSLTIRLPRTDGGSDEYKLREAGTFLLPSTPSTSRVAYAAAHVVCDPLTTTSHGVGVSLDWDATLAYRHHLWSYGLGVAEAMDTAQRGMGLNWSLARE